MSTAAAAAAAGADVADGQARGVHRQTGGLWCLGHTQDSARRRHQMLMTLMLPQPPLLLLLRNYTDDAVYVGDSDIRDSMGTTTECKPITPGSICAGLVRSWLLSDGCL